MRFELEDGGRISTRKELVRFGIVQGKAVDVNFHAAILLNHANSVVEYGQRREAEKIHL